MTDDEFGAFVDSAMDELNAKQRKLSDEFGLGALARWWFDQETEELGFFDESNTKVLEAKVVDIGSYASNSNTWKWAWANDSVLPGLREKAISLKALADLTGEPLFAEVDPFEVEDEHMAWELAAVAVRHLGAIGVYKAPSTNKPMASFLAITSIRRLRGEPGPRSGPRPR